MSNYLIPIILIILIILIIIFFNLSKKENYVMDEIGNIPDDVWLYEILPQYDVQTLLNFSRISKEGRRLVEKFLRNSPIKNIELIKDLIYFNVYVGRFNELLGDIFNSISPNSSRMFSLGEDDEEILLLNKSLLPSFEVNKKTGRQFSKSIKPDENFKLNIKMDEDNKNVEAITIFIRDGTNLEINNNLNDLIDSLPEAEEDAEIFRYRRIESGGLVPRDDRDYPITNGDVYVFLIDSKIYNTERGYKKFLKPKKIQQSEWRL